VERPRTVDIVVRGRTRLLGDGLEDVARGNSRKHTIVEGRDRFVGRHRTTPVVRGWVAPYPLEGDLRYAQSVDGRDVGAWLDGVEARVFPINLPPSSVWTRSAFASWS
jgi:hypothetical protein